VNQQLSISLFQETINAGMWIPLLIFCLCFCFPATTLAAADSLAAQVTIYRDQYGVPHIVGETEQATFFGYGYAQAQDHLEAMMLQYLDAQGRRAEVLGFDALGEGYLRFIPYHYRWGGDYLQRLLRTKKTVVENRAKIDPDVYRILEGFARGVNEYIREHRTRIPSWIAPITAEDVEALERSHYFRFYSVHDALSKIPGQTYSFPHLGSNQWALAREKSATGEIMHVEHTHMPWANRFQNYEAHLITPGRLNAGGISWFGSPFFLNGFNDRITWSATWNDPNIADVYEEKLNPQNPRQYLYEGKWQDMRVEHEPFRVRGPKGLDTLTLPLHYTHHGPVVRIDRERNRAWSVKLPNFEGVNYSANLYGFMKATDLPSFKAVLARQLMPRWNLLYSDRQNIYWIHNAVVATRGDGFDWSKPVPGWSSATEWGPYLPFAAQPQITNPSSGFLQNCNNPHWTVTRNSGLDPQAPAPYYLKRTPSASAGEESLNTRGERLFSLFTQPRKFTIEDMVDLGFDTYVMAADVIVPLLERASASLEADHPLKPIVGLLGKWDRRSSVSSTAYTYLHYWGQAYGELFGPSEFARFNAYSRHSIDLNGPEEQKRALSALEEAVRRITSRHGKSEVSWGEINIVKRGGEFPLGGTGMFGVLHPDTGPVQDDGRIHSNDGWGHLMVVLESNPKQIWTLLPYGQSEDPSSPHYNDQAKLHSQRKLKRFWFMPEEVLQNAKPVWGDPQRLKRWRPTPDR
jgi:acyl-homoserine-lactone acylase